MQHDTASLGGRNCRASGLNVLLWSVAASLIAPAALTIGVGAVALARGAGVMAIGSMLYVGYFAFLASMLFALLPYTGVLVAWAAIAHRVRVGERSVADLLVLTALLAIPAGLVAAGWGGDREWIRGILIWGAAWIGLAVPRLMIRRLGPRAFSGPTSDAPAT